ncbi:hypothetical protein LOC68_21060 [Blastopirellula sp. JC732]|uniref:Uncharacterized protein n=1 Tax=Blastopirellula sediminis TaxID=2894196 RepID=A0A9X1MP39_9BACT|nr:hypothetical protein [Blastopirellula sediminis]MCC9605812.1 hypothetical protein [Blastopirellula sediminis]MCC9630888.1 hypothetical protein [Blastopirellula sediminis]
MPDARESNVAAACPCCGGSEFVSGTIQPYRSNTFVPKDASFWKILGGYARVHEVTHRACCGCGLVLTFLKRPLPRPKSD